MQYPLSCLIPVVTQDVYMKTAKRTPSPATVTNPPFCDSNAGAPAVVDLTVPPVVVDEEEFVFPVALPLAVEDAEALAVPDAFPLDVAFAEVFPVALVPADVVSVPAVLPAFVEDWVFT